MSITPDQIELATSEENLLAKEIKRQRVQRRAKRQLDAEERPPSQIPEPLTLTQRLARPTPPLVSRIDEWQAVGHRVILAAQYKAGKTTLVTNLVRSLVDGDPFLGQWFVTPAQGRVGILDFEMSGAQLDRWYREQRIKNTDRVYLEPLRGLATAFNILDEKVRAEWAKRLRDMKVSYLALDCLRPLLDALGLDENHDTGQLLLAFDQLLAEAEISEALIVHHMGHDGLRSRGDSRLLDWPDATWSLMRKGTQADAPRTIKAEGRDVSIWEQTLELKDRRLSVTGHRPLPAASKPTLKLLRRETVLAEMVKYLEGNTDKKINQTMLTNAIMAFGFTKAEVRDCLSNEKTQGAASAIQEDKTTDGLIYSLRPWPL